MKICVLQPDYSDSSIDYGNYDPRRDLSALYPEAQVDHVFLKKTSTYAQLKACKAQNYDVFVNLCEGYLEWDIPSIDVVHSLELLNLPYTGPTLELYDPPKELMKYVAFTSGVKTPAFCTVGSTEDLKEKVRHLRFPLFVKPAKAGDSLGIDEGSKVPDFDALMTRVSTVISEYGDALIEEFIEGRELTVLVAADAALPGRCISFKPVEYLFGAEVAFKTYALKTSDLHPNRNVPCDDAVLAQRLRESSERIFQNFAGKSYARMDYRVDPEGNIYFLEVNFGCSVFYKDGYEGSADFIVKYDGIGQSGFLKHIVAEALARFERRQPVFEVKGNALEGYGIYAKRALSKGEVIFNGEGRSQRVVTRRYAEAHPALFDPLTFRRYAYPLSSELFMVWDEAPSGWSPQNHSCEPNCMFSGLNVVTLQEVGAGEELTLDYASFVDERAEPFLCHCRTPSCRGLIRGTQGNTMTCREEERAQSQVQPKAIPSCVEANA